MSKLANWRSIVVRKLSSQPARFSLPHMDPLLGSSRARFNATFRNSAIFSARCPFRFRAWSSLNATSKEHHIQAPVQFIFYAPMAPGNLIEPLRRKCLAQQVVAMLGTGPAILIPSGGYLVAVTLPTAFSRGRWWISCSQATSSLTLAVRVSTRPCPLLVWVDSATGVAQSSRNSRTSSFSVP